MLNKKEYFTNKLCVTNLILAVMVMIIHVINYQPQVTFLSATVSGFWGGKSFWRYSCSMFLCD